ncbi:unnamed protein product [Rhodiola kirilowii]
MTGIKMGNELAKIGHAGTFIISLTQSRFISLDLSSAPRSSLALSSPSSPHRSLCPRSSFSPRSSLSPRSLLSITTDDFHPQLQTGRIATFLIIHARDRRRFSHRSTGRARASAQRETNSQLNSKQHNTRHPQQDGTPFPSRSLLDFFDRFHRSLTF